MAATSSETPLPPADEAGRNPVRRGVWRLGKVIDGLAGIAMLATSVVLLSTAWGNRTAAPPPPPRLALPEAPVSLAGAESKGNTSAAVVLIEYADFQCPFCAQANKETVAEILKDYVDTGLVRLAFRHVALDGIHPFAIDAGVAAECAGRQSLFWPMHDQLFENQRQLDSANQDTMAKALGLDMREFLKCKADPTVKASVMKESNENKALGIRSTPTFIVGKVLGGGTAAKLVEGFSGVGRTAAIREALDGLLK